MSGSEVDDAARMEAALLRIHAAYAKRRAMGRASGAGSQANAGVEVQGQRVPTATAHGHEDEIAARLDALITELRGLLAPSA